MLLALVRRNQPSSKPWATAGRSRASSRLGLSIAAAAVCGVAGAVGGVAGLPAPWLVGGLLGGLAIAATRSAAPAIPRPLVALSRAAVGVAIGAQVRPEALVGVGGAWWLVLAVVALTLALSIVVALVLARLTDLDRLTAGFGLLPGAAPALIALGDETGADGRLVATMQFGRVLLVVASVPPLALLLGAGGAPGEGGGAAAAAAAAGGSPSGLVPFLTAVGIAVAGALLARFARAPAGTLVGPLLLSAAASVTGVVSMDVPPPVADAALALVGATVGLRFDRDSLRHAGRLAPAMAGVIVAVIAASAALGAVLLGALDTDPLSAYLATTPGGISGVLAAALDSRADLTIVVAVQTLRLLLLALAVPFAARLLRVGAPA